jgi:hypothetical protein
LKSAVLFPVVVGAPTGGAAAAVVMRPPPLESVVVAIFSLATAVVPLFVVEVGVARVT